MNVLSLVLKFVKVLFPLRSLSALLNVEVDLGLLLLVPGRWPHFLRSPPGPKPSLVPLLLLVPLILRFLLQSPLLIFLHLILSLRVFVVLFPTCCLLGITSIRGGISVCCPSWFYDPLFSRCLFCFPLFLGATPPSTAPLSSEMLQDLLTPPVVFRLIFLRFTLLL